MRKLFAVMLAAIMVLSMCACNATSDTTEKEPDSSTTSEWKAFIKEYDAWVDKYIALVEKYKANPTDTTILSDYTEMANEVAQWAEKADKITQELIDSPKEAAEYAAELQRIAAKLAQAIS